MRKFGAIAVLAISSLAASTALAADGPKPEDKIVCKSKPRTGTRFATKTCRTVAEWDAIAEQSRREAAEMINRPVINTERGG